MRKILSVLLVLSMSLVFITGCSSGGGGEDVISIGFVGPLTGDSTPWGEAQLNAIKMMVDETNAQGGVLGKQVKLHYYDNRADNVETANAARKLIQQDKVCAIIGTNSSGTSIAMASVCDEFKVPMIATNATNVQVTMKDGEVRPYSFRVVFTDPQLGGIIATYAYNEMGLRKVATLYEIGSDYSMGVQDAFKKTFEEIGGTILTTEAFKTGDVDFRAQLSKIKEVNPEAIFLPALYKQIGLAANQSRDLGINSIFLGTDSWLSNDILQLAGPAVEGSVFTASIDIKDPILSDIKEQYKKIYNENIDDMGTTGYFGYDAYKVLIAAIEKAGGTDSVAIRDALEKTTDVKGCIGNITLNPENHNPTRPAAVMKVENGSFKSIKTFIPEN